jgi:cobalt-zinc-cadmium efflux system outer membrane protein
MLGLLLAGCHACLADQGLDGVEAQVAAVAKAQVVPDGVPPPDPLPALPESLDLSTLWTLALAHNPALREAAADVEAARGQALQARLYPNPRVSYSEESIGTPQAPAGAFVIQITQEIVTAHKRRLDMGIAGQATDVATVALLGRKFDVLTRIRRAYFDYLAWWYTIQAQRQVLATLEQGLSITREQVRQGFRLEVDLTRLQAVYEDAKSSQERSRINLAASWRQLAAEVGLPQLPPPATPAERAETVPRWDQETVAQRVLAANTDLKQAAAEVERARLEVERTRADAVPNVTVGGGYSRNFAENELGGVVSVETALPLWDRKQGRIQEAEARWARAQAALRTASTRLARDAAEAFGRYQAALQQEAALNRIYPLLEKSLNLVREGYKTNRETTVSDVLLAEEALNDNRLRTQEVRRDLWRAVADLEGLMQLDVGEENALPCQSEP